MFERQARRAVPALKAMVENRPNAFGRLHAIWTLQLLSSLDTGSIEIGLADPEPRVREAVIRLAEARLQSEPELLSRILALVADPDPMVRFQLAFSLGEARDGRGVLTALASIAAHDATDQWIRTAVLSSIAGRSIAFLDAFAKRDGLKTHGPAQLWIYELAFQVGCGRRTDDAKQFLDKPSGLGVGSGGLIRALLALGRGQMRRGGSFQALFIEPSLPVARTLLNEAAKLAASEIPTDDRLAAIRLLGLGDVKTGRRVFSGLLNAREPTSVQLEVLQAIAGYMERSDALEIVKRWKTMSPSVRREAVEALFSRPEGIEVLLSAVESRSLTASEIDLARLQASKEFKSRHPAPRPKDRGFRNSAIGRPSSDCYKASASARSNWQPRTGT